MRSLIRLYCDIPLEIGSVVPLTSEQGHYLRSVMRQGEGDKIELFNGRDGAIEGVIRVLTKRQAHIELTSLLREQNTLLPVRLFFAPIKRGPMEMIIQKGTELGATILQPVMTKRTTAKSINFQRLNTIAIEAAEQCERLSVPVLDEVTPLIDALKEWDFPVFFADESGDDVTQDWGGSMGRAQPFLKALEGVEISQQGAGILIGPEGGFSPEERTMLRDHPQITPIGLGTHILRADTAAMSAMTLLQAYLEG